MYKCTRPRHRRLSTPSRMDAEADAGSFSLQVQREELVSLPAARAVYVRKSKLFFKTNTKDGLERNAAASAAAAAATAESETPVSSAGALD